MKRTGLVVVMGLCLLAVGAGAADWPQWRGPNKDGISPDKGINKNWTAKPPKVLWKFAMSDGGYSGPSLAGGKVFILDDKDGTDIIRALDANKGTELWKYEVPGGGGKSDYGWTRSTPIFDSGKVYAVSAAGPVVCLDAVKGTKVWDLNMTKEFGGKQPGWRYAGSPVVDGDRLILLPGGATLAVALNKADGKVIWKNSEGQESGYATPVIAQIGGKKQYVIYPSSGPMGLDAATGATIWKHAWKTSYDVNAATPIVSGNSVFITSGYKTGCALLEISGGNASVKWQNKDMQSHFNSPIFKDGYIYGTTDPGRLVCMNLADGKVQWDMKGFGKGGLVGVDGVLLVQDEKSGDITMCEMNSKEYKELGKISKPAEGGEPYWTAPVVGDGKLLVRSKKELVCLDLK